MTYQEDDSAGLETRSPQDPVMRSQLPKLVILSCTSQQSTVQLYRRILASRILGIACPPIMASPRPFFLRFRFNVAQARFPSRRHLSTPTSPSPAPNKFQSRLRQFNDRLPAFLRSYTTPLLGAPISHVTSFLILHEMTAILPLFGLVAAFHYGNWMPNLSSETGENNAFDEGAARFGKWLRKKGWVEESDVNTVAEHEVTASEAPGRERAGVRLVLEFATAYAITKALLPVRIAASVWATPWFARAVLKPSSQAARRLFGRS